MCAPKAPNPVATAAAQSASNRETAITQANLGFVNQTDALGNKLEYNQTDTWSDGTPRYSATQTLSAPSQQLLNTGQQTSQNLANLAQEQSGRLSGLLNEPIDFSAQKNYLNDLTAQNLDPMWARQEEQFQQSLVNRGIRPGSTAYQQQLADFQNNKSSAYNNSNLNNYNSALQSQLALRQAPINEIAALAGGSQVQSPQFASTSSTPVAGTDVAGITQAGYANQMAGYNSNQGVLGGLFSAGASLIPLLSDIRVKDNVKRIGSHPVGVGIYEYDRVDTGDREVGVIAQELAFIRPDMVDSTFPDGMLRVYYWKLNQEFPDAHV